ncbi:uncharacterized protein [Diabrotica undecimpunctata]|uniref:uncharacterized protein n=1 Tax=Diabrotica undecimpunctata TaxID=50387 RepID=UPI003B63D959
MRRLSRWLQFVSRSGRCMLPFYFLSRITNFFISTTQIKDMSGNRFFRELEALEADEVFQLIEEIPSGEESEASEIDSDDDGREDEPPDDTNDESFVIEDDLQEIQNTAENEDTGTDIEIESSNQESSEDETGVNRKRKLTKKNTRHKYTKQR